MNIEQIKSPSYMTGRRSMAVDMIVLHSIVGTMEHAIREFKNPLRRASAHYAVDGGRIVQFVDEANTAWHCGTLVPVGWNNNYHTIGIETQGGGSFGEATPETKATTAALVLDIATRRNIPLARTHIKEHGEMPGCNTSCASGLNADEIVALAIQLRDAQTPQPAPIAPAPEPTPVGRPVPVFPMSVTITAPVLRVRTAPSTAAPTARPYPSVGRSVGIPTITVIGRVDGQVIDGNGVWLTTVRGNYVWSAGTSFTKYL